MKNIILEKLRAAFFERSDLETLPESVWKRSSALNTWGTNAIEGSTISREDAEKIILEGKSVKGKPIRDIAETMDHERAFRGLLKLRKKEIDLETVLELHEKVFLRTKDDAGQWRRVNVRIKGADYTPPRWEKVVNEMKEWKENYRERDIDDEDPFSLGAWMHYEFERIHPFSDGNGRVGRLLLNLHFLKRNWSPIHVLPINRDKYLKALNKAAKDDFLLLEEFIKFLIGGSLLDILDQVGVAKDELISLKEATRLSPYDRKYLALRCKQGELPAFRTGKKWMTSERALELYSNFVSNKEIRIVDKRKGEDTKKSEKSKE